MLSDTVLVVPVVIDIRETDRESVATDVVKTIDIQLYPQAAQANVESCA